ncbi:serine protease [Lachnospiraceae bacterium MD335]|nr:serine protease [Lachnospiraceae bacterium MD335]
MTENEKNEEIKNHDTASDFDFLQEKIKERPINKKKLLKKTIITAMMAVLFGLLACLSFLLLEPVLNNWLYPEEAPEVVTFPPEQEEMLPEDMLTEGGSTQPSQTVSESEEVQSTQQPSQEDSPTQTISVSDINNMPESGTHEAESMLGDETQELTLKPYQTQYEELYQTYKDISSSMVTVTAVHSDVDWFNNTYQSEGTTAGVIIANNNRELLILARKSPLGVAESIRVTFCNGVNADAEIKKYDKNTDLAVFAVDLKYVGSATLDYVSVAVLGSSAPSGIVGKPVIAIGNLFGYKDNVCYGIITSKGNNVELADNEYKLITTDIYASENPSGILVSLEGEVIGMIDNSYNNSDTKNLLSAVGITELKGMITKLSNGEDIPYLGIYTQDITSQVKIEMGLPQGAYIFDIDMDSPAMLNGMQKGDIIVQVGAQEIRSPSDYMNALRAAVIDRNLKIIVQRASGDSYEEMTFTVQPVHRD